MAMGDSLTGMSRQQWIQWILQQKWWQMDRKGDS